VSNLFSEITPCFDIDSFYDNNVTYYYFAHSELREEAAEGWSASRRSQ